MRKFIIVLAVIFYASSLLIVIAAHAGIQLDAKVYNNFVCDILCLIPAYCNCNP
jgi:hypothetical protein